MSKLIKSPIDEFIKEIEDLANETLNIILKQNQIDNELLINIQQPIKLIENSFEENKENLSYFEEIVNNLENLLHVLIKISDNLPFSNDYKINLQKFHDCYDQMNLKCKFDGFIFTPTKSKELSKLEKLSLFRIIHFRISFITYQVRCSIIFINILKDRIYPFSIFNKTLLDSKQEDFNSFDCISSLPQQWWDFIIIPYCDDFLNHIDCYIPYDDDDQLQSVDLSKNIRLLEEILSKNDPYHLAELESQISCHLYPMFDFYTKQAYSFIPETFKEISIDENIDEGLPLNIQWEQQLGKDIQALLTIKCPPSNSQILVHQASEGIYCLHELIRREFLNRKDFFTKLYENRRSKKITQSISSPTISRRKYAYRDLRKLLKTDPTFQTLPISGN